MIRLVIKPGTKNSGLHGDRFVIVYFLTKVFLQYKQRIGFLGFNVEHVCLHKNKKGTYLLQIKITSRIQERKNQINKINMQNN